MFRYRAELRLPCTAFLSTANKRHASPPWQHLADQCLHRHLNLPLLSFNSTLTTGHTLRDVGNHATHTPTHTHIYTLALVKIGTAATLIT